MTDTTTYQGVAFDTHIYQIFTQEVRYSCFYLYFMLVFAAELLYRRFLLPGTSTSLLRAHTQTNCLLSQYGRLLENGHLLLRIVRDI
jgi:hypothetical protein